MAPPFPVTTFLELLDRLATALGWIVMICGGIGVLFILAVHMREVILEHSSDDRKRPR